VDATRLHLRQDDHDRLKEEIEAFLARGGEIEKIPPGVMKDTGFPARVQPECARQPYAPPRPDVKPARAPKPAPAKKALAPTKAAPKPKPAKKAPWGVKTRTALEVLYKHGPMSSAELARLTGEGSAATKTRLWQLRKQGLVRSSGGRFDMVWRAVLPCR